MARLGLFSLPWRGHIAPLSVLAHTLRGRGHEIVSFHLPEFRPAFESRDLLFQAYGEGTLEPDTFRKRNEELSRLSGEEAVANAVGTTRLWSEVLLREAEPVVRAAAPDLWLVDHMDYAASVLARKTGSRFVTVITTLMRHFEVGVPGFTGEPHSETPRPESGQTRLAQLVRPLFELLDHHSLRAGLGPFGYHTVWSNLAQITQQPAEFEFPRENLPECFHFTAPFLPREAPDDPEFPWERLEVGRPVVCASLGSVHHGQRNIYHTILKATEGLDINLVLSLGETQLETPDRVLALPRIPQFRLLGKTDLMIHHAGMNSTLECLATGVPMVCCPLASDQPGIAARVEWSGTGLVVNQESTVERWRESIVEVLNNPRFRERAGYFQRVMGKRDGPNMAADLIESVL